MQLSTVRSSPLLSAQVLNGDVRSINCLVFSASLVHTRSDLAMIIDRVVSRKYGHVQVRCFRISVFQASGATSNLRASLSTTKASSSAWKNMVTAGALSGQRHPLRPLCRLCHLFHFTSRVEKFHSKAVRPPRKSSSTIHPSRARSRSPSPGHRLAQPHDTHWQSGPSPTSPLLPTPHNLLLHTRPTASATLLALIQKAAASPGPAPSFIRIRGGSVTCRFNLDDVTHNVTSDHPDRATSLRASSCAQWPQGRLRPDIDFR